MVTSGPILLQHVIGLTPVAFGWVFPIPGIAFAIGALINSQYVERLGVQFMLQLGMSCMLIAGLLMLGLKFAGHINVFVIVGPATLLLFSVPIIFNNSFAGAFEPFPHIAGMAGALFGMLTTLGGAATSSLLAFSSDKDQIPMATVHLLYYFRPKLVFIYKNQFC